MAKLTRAEIREGLTQIPIDVLLVGNNKNVQLTSKEEKFVKGLVEGKPKAQSYREAYNTKSTKQRQASDASKLAKKPKIAQRLGEEMLRKRYLTNGKNPKYLNIRRISSLNYWIA